MDAERAERQLAMIADVVAMAGQLGVQVWLRGGWAMNFCRGRVTRDHVDIDWTGWIDDAPAITAALHADGYRMIAGPPHEQQLDVVRDDEEMSFGWLARAADGTVVIAGGRYAGEPWPNAIPARTPGRIGPVQCPILGRKPRSRARK